MKNLTKTIIFFSIFAVAFFALHYGTAMKGSESGSNRYLKEESFYQRYGVSPDGLVLWLDQSDPRSYGDTANWYDMSGQGNHGTQGTAASQPAITSATNLSGFARDFDGDDDYFLCSSPFLSGSDTYSISVWIKHDGSGGMLFGDYPNSTPYIYLSSTDTKIKNTNSEYVTLTHTFTANIWYHITYVRNGGTTVDFYVNGVKEGSDDFTTSLTETFDQIARYGQSASLFFDGLIDEVHVFNQALTVAEIERLYLVDKPRHGGL